MEETVSSSCDNKIIVALDYDNKKQALELSKKLDPSYCRLKIGKQLFTKYGPTIVDELQKMNFEIFLDLKFHDIPITVYKACSEAYKLGVWMLNIHLLGGKDMVLAAKEARDMVNKKSKIIGVTLLTSHNQEGMAHLGMNTREDIVKSLSIIASDAKIDGVVCSPGDISSINTSKNNLEFITPGIRLSDASNDHSKIYTPSTALELGSSYLVIGRPITEAKDPMSIVEQIKLMI
ncbi:MAG: orotidine-5'-phosphate decarboxylase [Gammaproteobacteria bacterium]|jgi:orotidine-5'-phosphate decarboxylase|tara:strand:- start:1750 stop:2451 length:702 start_codon:yes stop_codon:yes gene_type:complete